MISAIPLKEVYFSINIILILWKSLVDLDFSNRTLFLLQKPQICNYKHLFKWIALQKNSVFINKIRSKVIFLIFIITIKQSFITFLNFLRNSILFILIHRILSYNLFIIINYSF